MAKRKQKKDYQEYKPLNKSEEILNEIVNKMIEEKPREDNVISLYDVACLIKKYDGEYEDTKKSYERQFKQTLDTTWGDCGIVIYGFDYGRRYLQIGFSRALLNWQINDYYDIDFAKRKGGSLYVAKSKSEYSQELLTRLGDGLSELYDQFISFADFKTQKSFSIKPLNSNFFVDINCDEISISDASRAFWLSSENDNGYVHKCNSHSLVNALQGKEDELFQSLFVKIDSCPEWSRQELYQIRQEQLAKEEEKEKKLEFKRRLFPWRRNRNK